LLNERITAITGSAGTIWHGKETKMKKLDTNDSPIQEASYLAISELSNGRTYVTVITPDGTYNYVNDTPIVNKHSPSVRQLKSAYEAEIARLKRKIRSQKTRIRELEGNEALAFADA
jgi:hypothetical protein